ncbi:helix-turn-helix domain-containing protein [Actinosynnema sp. NPDC047251]|uniref:winged helix-turn-helix domain-containing protein n=1 Tax=Saccharothrix espanaensis TaxID=103731 RepID=UPI000316B33D|nr:helix-turn-helix domain-containing protein [Saccharothrix espanaensis]
MGEIVRIGTPEQFEAPAHPLRQRLLFVLGREPATTSGLAVALMAAKESIGHHLKVLRAAGLVRVVETGQVRGGTEQHYQRTFRRTAFAAPEAEHTSAMFGAVAEEVVQDPTAMVTLRHLRLTPDAAGELGQALRALIADAAGAGGAGGDESVHGVLVTVYRQS